MNIWLDTDIGTDVDDALALSYLDSQKANVYAISTVGGDTVLRTHITRRFLDELSFSPKVIPGYDKSLGGELGYLSGVEATRYNIRKRRITKRPIEGIMRTHLKPNTTLICMGALTNVASTLQKYPSLAEKIDNIYFMGGVDETIQTYTPSVAAHNVKQDHKAAQIVFGAGIPLTVLDKVIPLQFPYSLAEFTHKFKNRSDLHQLLFAHADEMIQKSKRETVQLYDPLLCMIALNPHNATYTQKKHIRVVSEVHFNPKDHLESALEVFK